MVVFHRVLRRDDSRWNTALLPWTIDDDTFDRCLQFFKLHYRLISLDELRAAMVEERRLPSRSLLVTIDDGFADCVEYALPLLRKHKASAIVFVTSDMIGRERWLWTDDLLWQFMNGGVRQQELAELYVNLFDDKLQDPDDPNLIWRIVRKGAELDEARVREAMSALKIDLGINGRYQMLTADDIRKLVANGISVGAHGKTHVAMSLSSDLSAELRSPIAVLSHIVGLHGQSQLDALSFPHGAYNSGTVGQALAAGYKLLFSGEAQLLVLKDGLLTEPLIPRIEIDSRRIAPSGRFRPDCLASLLFTAPRRRTDVDLRTDDDEPAIELAAERNSLL